MNKADLIDLIAARTGQSRLGVTQVLDAQAEVITGHLAAADAGVDAEATLPGLGKLKTKTRAERTGRNPQTGAPVPIPSRVAVKFAAGKALTDALNG